MMQTANPVKEAVAAVGSQERLAELIGCSQQNISLMVRSGRASPRLAREIERVTGGAVPRHRLCPDIFDPPADPSHPCEGASA